MNTSFDGNAEETRRLSLSQPGWRISGLLWWVEHFDFFKATTCQISIWAIFQKFEMIYCVFDFFKYWVRNANLNNLNHMSAKRRRLAYTIGHVTCGFKTQATIVTIWSNVMTGSSWIVGQSRLLITPHWILFAKGMELRWNRVGNLFQSRSIDSVTKHMICNI